MEAYPNLKNWLDTDVCALKKKKEKEEEEGRTNLACNHTSEQPAEHFAQEIQFYGFVVLELGRRRREWMKYP